MSLVKFALFMLLGLKKIIFCLQVLSGSTNSLKTWFISALSLFWSTSGATVTQFSDFFLPILALTKFAALPSDLHVSPVVGSWLSSQAEPLSFIAGRTHALKQFPATQGWKPSKLTTSKGTPSKMHRRSLHQFLNFSYCKKVFLWSSICPFNCWELSWSEVFIS